MEKIVNTEVLKDFAKYCVVCVVGLVVVCSVAAVYTVVTEKPAIVKSQEKTPAQTAEENLREDQILFNTVITAIKSQNYTPNQIIEMCDNLYDSFRSTEGRWAITTVKIEQMGKTK